MMDLKTRGQGGKIGFGKNWILFIYYLFLPLTLVRVCYFTDPTKLKTLTRLIMKLNFWTFVRTHNV